MRPFAHDVDTDVRLRDHGSDLIEVIDNGTGIDERNHAALGANQRGTTTPACVPPPPGSCLHLLQAP